MKRGWLVLSEEVIQCSQPLLDVRLVVDGTCEHKETDLLFYQ